MSPQPLVLLHGLSGCPDHWNPTRPALEQEHQLLIPVLAGHFGGASLGSRRAGPLWAIDLLASQIEREMDAAGVSRAHVCGNSLGGWLALELARRGRAHSVVAISPAGGWEQDSPEQRRIHRQMRANHAAARIVGPFAHILARVPGNRRRLLASVMEHGNRLSCQEAAAIVRAAWKCPSYRELLNELVLEGPRFRCEGIAVPVVLAWGTRDRLLPARSYSCRYRQQLHDACFVELPGAGHIPMADDPRGVIAAIRQAADRLAAAP